MRLSEAWLREWVNPDLDSAALAEQLTMAGLEVDSVESTAAEFSGVVVAIILSVEKHPKGDRLHVCTVDTGDGKPLIVVCGASNARAGLRVPLARVGAVLPGGMQIRQAPIREVDSAGMLCSAGELGLAETSDGLLELPEDAPIGQDLSEYLQLDDHVLSLELTPNRGDCLSVQGIARELAALNALPLSGPGVDPARVGVSEVLAVRIENPAACRRYAGRVITGINPVTTTPAWMRERLRRSGLRSIHPVVDITNYVMLELGQPLHAFDLGKLQGGIFVRSAKQGETLTLLDEQTVNLHESTLVIADASGPIAMAGIMGGLGTAVDSDTTSVFFESACFLPAGMAGQGRRYKIHTDALHRFERGVDPELQVRAIERATQLLLEVAGGTPGPVTDVRADKPVKPDPVRLRHSKLNHLLGAELPESEVERILHALDMRVTTTGMGEWDVVPPTWRYDIAIEADLIEEVARVHGYARLPLCSQQVALPAVVDTELTVPDQRLRECLVQRGYQEVITYSFVDPALQSRLDPEASAIDIDNPIAAQLAQMRTTLWSSLLPIWLYNRQRQQSRLRLFELGMRFLRDGQAPDGIRQETMLAGLVSGSVYSEQWGQLSRPVDFHDLKGDVESVLRLGGGIGRCTFSPELHPALHPGQSAKLLIDGQAAGWLGRLHPGLAGVLETKEDLPLVFELSTQAIRATTLPIARDIPDFPFIRRDLALIVPESVSVKALLDCLQSADESALQDVLVFDVYRGKGLQSGFKSVAFGLIFQDYSRTLTDTEVDQSVARLQDRTKTVLGATVRG